MPAVQTGRRRGLPLGEPEPLLPLTETEDFVVIDATTPLRRLLDLNRSGGPAFVVVRRDNGGTMFHYAFRLSELQRLVGQNPIGEVLPLHEADASADLPNGTAGYTPPADTRGGPASRFRAVVTVNGEPVAVVHREPWPILRSSPPLNPVSSLDYYPGYSEGGAVQGIDIERLEEFPTLWLRRSTEPAAPVAREPLGAPPVPAADEPSPGAPPSPDEVASHFLAEADSEIKIAEANTLNRALAR